MAKRPHMRLSAEELYRHGLEALRAGDRRTYTECLEELTHPQRSTRIAAELAEKLADHHREFSKAQAAPSKVGAAARRDSEAERARGDEGTSIIDNRYELGECIGEGGFGRVWEATRILPPRERVVIKTGIPGRPDRLLEEIGVAYRLTHQNICSYKDYGSDPTFGTYLVIAYGGRSLAAMIRERGEFAVIDALDVVAQTAAALDYAHGEDVIHHDVTPGNVLVDETRSTRRKVRLTDFGLSQRGKNALNTEGKHTIYGTTPVGHTPNYAAPEQRRGDAGRKASDQYSLALVFCSMLEGEVFGKPYRLKAHERLDSIQNAALRRALSDEPEARFDSCGEFVKELAGR
jgi:serine/threonine protein kinase